MKKRILRTNLLVLVVALVVALLLCTIVFERRSTAQVEGSMITLATMLAEALEESDEPHRLEEQVIELANLATGLRVSYIAPDGQLIADSIGGDALDINYLERDEVQEARQYGSGSDLRNSEELGKRWIFVAVKTKHGYLRLSRQFNRYGIDLFSLLPVTLASAGLALLVAVPLSERMSKSIIEPINTFSEGIDQVMDGKVNLDPEASPYPELQGMAVKINRLSSEVKEGFTRVEREHTRIETILASINEGFVMTDGNDDLILINKAACRILECEYPPKGNNLVYATRYLPLLEATEEVKKSGGSKRLEIKAQDGCIYDVSLTAVNTPGPDGSDSRALVMLLSDVTDKRQAAEMRQDFFQSASHELKTPITSIRGFAELLCTTQMDKERQQDFIERILKESQRMDSLIEDILMISRLESGDIIFEREKIDIYEVIRECCDDARPLAMENDIDIYFEGTHCQMYASRRELGELAGNLISNAVKYNQPEGYVEVKLRLVDGAPILTVFNTGNTIPARESKRIFERFYRMDRGRSKSVGGTGLGLAIVKQISAQYGAEVSLIPKKGIGNIFKVAFPSPDEIEPLLEEHASDSCSAS